MTHPAVHTIVQGQTLDLEVSLRGENLAGAATWVTVEPGLDLTEITTAVILPNTIAIRSTNTAMFLTGTHNMRLWIEWPDDDREPVLELKLVVVPALGSYITSDIVIDGGAPDTEFTESIDGGEA
jgi:hypothetical protein